MRTAIILKIVFRLYLSSGLSHCKIFHREAE